MKHETNFLLVKKNFKYFIDYKNRKKVRPLCTMLPKMSAYIEDFVEAKYMSFFIKKKKRG